MSEILEEHKLYLSHRQLLQVGNAFLQSSGLLQMKVDHQKPRGCRVPYLSWSDGLLDVRDDPVHHVLLLHPSHNIGCLQLVVQTFLNLEMRWRIEILSRNNYLV